MVLGPMNAELLVKLLDSMGLAPIWWEGHLLGWELCEASVVGPLIIYTNVAVAKRIMRTNYEFNLAK